MLKVYYLKDLHKAEIDNLCLRNVDEDNLIENSVKAIITEVKTNGDAALKVFTKQFDQVELDRLYVDKDELQNLARSVSDHQKKALNTAYTNIYNFHLSQVGKDEIVETMPGVSCWRDSRPIEKVGLYIPGGTAVLPSTFLMLGIPAKIAGCKEMVVCSPPQKDGKVNAFIAYCATLLNIDKIYLTGGAQAVAAMAYGTETIPKVDKIFGPGNRYVTSAKNIVQSTTRTAIDMPAGPSEVLIIANGHSNPKFVAADLAAQAEHGIDSQVVLISTSTQFVDDVLQELSQQLPLLSRSEIAYKAFGKSFAVIVEDLNQAMDFSNQYAPEHLILAIEDWQQLVDKIVNAGSVFLGNYSPESAGDYASGTNHTLPTSSYAKSHSGVSVDSFIKKITFQHITEIGLKNLGPTVEILADMEGLQAHKNAVTVRLQNLISDKEF
ncbi:MAG: histidinol dehydrogenase [Flavobacterium sp.]|nr:histidinol dehydrogenase [Pedobacter sp.]